MQRAMSDCTLDFIQSENVQTVINKHQPAPLCGDQKLPLNVLVRQEVIGNGGSSNQAENISKVHAIEQHAPLNEKPDMIKVPPSYDKEVNV